MAIFKDVRELKKKERVYWAICYKINWQPKEIYRTKKIATTFKNLKSDCRSYVVKKVIMKVI